MVARLDGKRALVLGAGGNLGSAIAREFAREGADLILSSVAEDGIVQLAEDARAMGRRARHLAADLTVPAEIDHLAEAAWAEFGGIDVVFISSQPANPKLGDLLQTDDAVWATWFQIMVWGPLRLMRTLAPRMMDAGGASVITVTSSTSEDPQPGFDAYGMGKAGLWWLTLAMAREWGSRGIRANALQPGMVATAGNFDALDAVVRANGLLDRTALRRIGRNEDCLGAAVFLASDEARYVSAQKLKVDGGRI